MPQLILIDSRVSDIDAILSALTSDTEYIVFSYFGDTFETLKTKITNNFTQYTHIAIAQHKYEISTFSLLDAMPPALLYELDANEKVGVSMLDPNLTTWKQFADFIVWLRETIGMHYLDLLACDLWSDPFWVYAINTLKLQCNVSIRASIDITGYGGNFILESDNVDMVGVYFTEAIINYKYSFVGNDFITLINTKSPWGVYSASKFNHTTNTLFELRGNGRSATTTGTFTAGSATGNGATGAIKYINGSTTSTVVWPTGSVPATHTMAYVTRYTNASGALGRILNNYDLSPNAMYGHHMGKRGVAYVRSNALTPWVTTGTITNWVNMVVKTGGTTPNNVLLDGVAYGTATDVNGVTGTLTINSQSGHALETSEFGFSYLMIWDQALTDAEMVIVSNQLSFYLATGNEPPVLTAFQTVMNNKPPWGIYRAIDWNSGTNTLPEARGITARNPTTTGTITYNNSVTGNGVSAGITTISGTTSSSLAWPAGSLATTYTVAFINRMVSNYGRIFQGTANNLLFGHWGGSGNRGVYYDKNQWINTTSYGTLTNWLTMACKVGASPNNCIVDGVSRGTTTSTALSAADTLKLNNGAYPTETSNWELSYLMVWDQALTDAEVAVVSNELLSYLTTGTPPQTTNYVLNGYFTGPALSVNSATLYSSPYSAIVNWTVTSSNTNIYIANQSTTWTYSTLPAGVTQWMVFQYVNNAGTSSITQNIYFGVVGNYALTYYTQARPGYTSNVITLGASIAGTSQSASVSATSWELRSFAFTIASIGTQTLSFSTAFNGGVSDTAIYLTAINIAPVAFNVPTEPTINSATGGAKSAVLSFSPPANNGGVAITDYQYSLNGGAYVSTGVTASPITITGLADNTTYTVSIVAVNSVGSSPSSNTSSFTTLNYPNPPTITSVTGSKLQLSVAFTDPSYNGGGAITNYLYSIDGGNTYLSGGVSASPLVINTGLVGNTTYTVTLKSVNALGNSTTASNSMSAMVYDVVSQPTIFVSTAYTSVIVTDVSYVSNGGSPATAFSYSTNGTNYTSTGSTTIPFSIPNLTAGTMYPVYVKVLNAYGLSNASAPVSMYASDYPAPPTITNVSSQDVSGALYITYTRPSYTGYNPITGWQVSTDGGVSFSTYSGDVSANPLVLTGLTNGETYSVYLKTTTIIGDSSASAMFTAKSILHPDAPLITSCIPGINQFTIAWTAPTYTGYDPIVNYSYSLNGGEYIYLNTDISPVTITGLTHQTYVVRLRAHNSAYASVASASVTVTPYLAPLAPVITAFSFGAKTVHVHYTVNTNDSSLNALVYSINGANDISTNAVVSPLPIPDLIEGVTYSVRIKVFNEAGASPYSDISCVTLHYSFSNKPSAVSIVSNGEIFVMTIKNEVNNNYNYKYSYDGIHWTSAAFSTTANPSSIKWMGNQFQVVGDTLLKSVDGIDFSQITNNISPTLTNTNDIYTNTEQPHSIFFPTDATLLCSQHQIAISMDGGFTWTSPITLFPSPAIICGAVWMGTQWVVLASNGIATSADGIQWVITAVTPVSQPKSIVWNAQQHKLLMVGVGGVATSSDGVFWNSLGKLNMDVGENGSWNGEKWVVYGTVGGNAVITESEDAVWWSLPENAVFPATFFPIINNQTQYLWIDVSANLRVSPDGVAWMDGASPFTPETHTAIAWNASTTGVTQIQPLTVAVGSGVYHTMAISSDGIFWRGVGAKVLETRANDVVWTGEYWVAVGASATSGVWCARSMDGIVWSGVSDRGLLEGVAVAWNGTVVVVVDASSGKIAVTVDTLEWEHVLVYGAGETPVKLVWTGSVWALFTTNGIYTTFNIYATSGWYFVQSSIRGIVQTPWHIYAQSASSPQQFTKYNVTTMTLLDASVNVPGMTASVTSSCYDGSSVLVGCADGQIGVWSLDAVYETQTTMPSASAISVCYNNLYSIVGEISGNAWYGKTPNWELGYNLPLSTITNVVSNSKYGVVYVPNTLYLNAGDTLQMTTPKYLNNPDAVVNIDLLRGL